MATQASTIEFLSDQLSRLPGLTSRKMFGEYALYVEGKVVAFVCDDKLFMKPNPADAGFRDKCVAGPAYPGSKDYWEVAADLWDEREWLVGIFQASADALPAPKPKPARKQKHPS